MSRVLKRDIFELRFFPMPAFFDRKSGLLDLLYRDPKSKKNNFQHWQLDESRIVLFDEDQSRTFMFSFQNCAYTCVNPPTENYARDQIVKYFGIAADYFGDKIESLQRAGFRETQVIPVKDFDELTENLVRTFLNTDNSFFRTLGVQVHDLQLFPVVFKHGTNRFQVTSGPARRDELRSLWGNDKELPEQALFLDVDYYAVRPEITDDITRYVAEFLARAKEIQSKITQELPAAVIKA